MTKTPNKQRNELTVTLGDYSVKCKMTFDAIVRIESLFDKTLFEIVQDLNRYIIRADKIADMIEIAAIDGINRDDLENAILDAGTSDSIVAVVPLLLTAFAGSNKVKPEEKKS